MVFYEELWSTHPEYFLSGMHSTSKIQTDTSLVPYLTKSPYKLSKYSWIALYETPIACTCHLSAIIGYSYIVILFVRLTLLEQEENQKLHYEPKLMVTDLKESPTQWPPLTSRIDWERLQRETTLHGRLLSAILSFSFYVYGFFANFRYDLIIRLFSDMFITRKHWRKINIPSLFSSL